MKGIPDAIRKRWWYKTAGIIIVAFFIYLVLLIAEYYLKVHFEHPIEP
ncbi:hypothetical protein BH11BAC2_BH11BAC2_18360 [soil metagenome]